MHKLLAKLSPKPEEAHTNPMGKENVFTKLPGRQTTLDMQSLPMAGNKGQADMVWEDRIPISLIAPTSDLPLANVTVDGCQPGTNQTDTPEVLRLKRELLAANSKIAIQEQELAQTRVIKHTLDQALGPPSEVDFGGREVTEQTISHLQNAFNASNPSFNYLQDGWNAQDDSQSDVSDALSAGAYNRARGLWVPPAQHVVNVGMNTTGTEKMYGDAFALPTPTSQESNRFWGPTVPSLAISEQDSFSSPRVIPGPPIGPCELDTRFHGEQMRFFEGSTPFQRRSITQANRGRPSLSTHSSSWASFSTGSSSNNVPRSPAHRPTSTYQQVGLYPIPAYHQQPVGTPLSPTATEFTSSTGNIVPWGTSSVRNEADTLSLTTNIS